MMYLKLTIYYGFLILLCRTNTTNNIFNKQEVYCGKKLINILKRFCLKLPTYDTGTLIVHRKKRQIVKECCKNKCSLNYLLDNYCQIINTSALEDFANNLSGSATSTTIRTSLQPTQRYSIKDIEYTTTVSTFSERRRPRRRYRRKRNCKCKEILNRNRVLRGERLLQTLRGPKVQILQPEIGEVEFRQKPFYMILS